MATNKTQILRDYVTYIDTNGIQQHTPEWLVAKKYVVGGSQMAVVLGCNGYETKKGAILQKLNFVPFGGEMVKCAWGNLFEDNIKLYVERYYKTEVMADNAFIPLTVGPLADRIAYSPDGLCVIDNNVIKAKIGKRFECVDALPDNQQSVVLLEFKAPYNRKTTPVDIPEYYVPQPLTGMDMIGPVIDGTLHKICDMALFIECEFRMCTYEQISMGRVHCEYPTSYPASAVDGVPHAFGLFIVYGPKKGPLADMIRENFDNELSKSNSLGTMEKKNVDKIIVAIDSKQLVSLHTGPCKSKDSLKRRRREILDDPSMSYSGLKNDISGLVAYGTMYWKLLTYRAKPMFPEQDYLEKNKDAIIEFTDAVKECSQFTDICDAEYFLDELFEN